MPTVWSWRSRRSWESHWWGFAFKNCKPDIHRARQPSNSAPTPEESIQESNPLLHFVLFWPKSLWPWHTNSEWIFLSFNSRAHITPHIKLHFTNFQGLNSVKLATQITDHRLAGLCVKFKLCYQMIGICCLPAVFSLLRYILFLNSNM